MGLFNRKKKYQLPPVARGLEQKASNHQASSQIKAALPKPLPNRDEKLGFILNHLPEGVEIKRTATRGSVNQNRWRVGYQGRTPVYYGRTLEQALQEFFGINLDVAGKYTQLLEKAGYFGK